MTDLAMADVQRRLSIHLPYSRSDLKLNVYNSWFLQPKESTMFGVKKSSSDESRAFDIPSFLTLFKESENRIHLDGTVELSWADSEIAFSTECNCLITKSRVGEAIVVRVTYEFFEASSPVVLRPLVPNSWCREMTFAEDGRLMGEKYPCLHLSSAESMVLQYQEADGGKLVETIQRSQIGLKTKMAEGALTTKIRDSEKQFIRSVELTSRENYETNADELEFKFFNTVDVKRLRNGPFRGALFSVDEIVVNEKDGSFVSVGLELPAGAWWLLDCRGRFYPSGTQSV